MGRSHTAFRLSGIRARDNAAESDEAMTSNDNKKKARKLQQENPGMKYTEALRHVETGTGTDLIHSWTSPESGKPHFFDVNADSHVLVGSGKGKHGFHVDEYHDVSPTEESRAMLDGLVRQARTAWRVRQNNFLVARTFLGIGTRYVRVDPAILEGDVMGESGDMKWVGYCATEEQARQAWRFLGSPGDEESLVPLFMSLESNQFVIRDRSLGRDWVEAVEIDDDGKQGKSP